VGRFGSASDELFNSEDELVYGGNAFLKIPHEGNNAFLFFVDYSQNREFLRYIPLPGAAYLYVPSRDVRMIIGVPFASLHYKPAERLTLNASYMPVRTVHTKLSYAVTDSVSVFGAFDWQNLRYFRADRPEEKDRLYYYEMLGSSGIEFKLTEKTSIAVRGGYSFERFIFEAKKYSKREVSKLDIDDAWFVEVRARILF
jgi:hypothetical protein